MYTLLVADDEFNIRDGLVHAMPWESLDVQVVAEARDGLEALELALECRPDLVITDISMDRMNGLEFAASLLAQRPQTKVIILSGYGEFSYAQRAVELKVWAYLLKPVTPEELLDKVASAIASLGPGVLASPEGSAERAVIRRARDYLESHCEDHELSLEVLSRALELTPAYLSKLFKSETGRNYSDELTDLRMEKAKELLRRTNLKTSEIGSRVGYPNAQYFATAFRKATGTTPSEFRERS